MTPVILAGIAACTLTFGPTITCNGINVTPISTGATQTPDGRVYRLTRPGSGGNTEREPGASVHAAGEAQKQLQSATVETKPN